MDIFDRYAYEATRDHALQPEPYKRSFFERLFAPFEAPQQTLFSLTKEIANDGFQFRDIWDSLAHGARYFNPFSNERRIDEEEVRSIFFGEQANDTFKFAQNLAISLLYDPLLVTGALKAVGVSGRALQIADRVSNPAMLMLDGARVGSKQVLRGVQSAAERVLGAERATELGARFIQNWVNANHGIDPDILKLREGMEQQVNAWRSEAYSVFKKAKQLGVTGRGQELLTEALEMEAAWLRHTGQRMSRSQAGQLGNFTQRLLKNGIDPDNFWEIYRRGRNLDTRIGQELVDLGVLDYDQFKQMQGTHLRRIYAIHEKPDEYIERIAALGIEPTLRPNDELYKGLNEFRDTLNVSLTGREGQGFLFGLAEQVGGTPNAVRYFDDNNRFHVERFVQDLGAYLRKHPTDDIDTLLEYVTKNMLDGVQIPERMMSRLANYISTGYTRVPGSEEIADKMRAWYTGPSVFFREFKERVEVIAQRTDIPDEIRAIMGEVTAAAPRIASEVNKVAPLLEMRRFLDQVRGNIRLDSESLEELTRVRQLGLDTPEARQVVTNLAEKWGIDMADMPRILEGLDDGTLKVGDVINTIDNRFSSATKDVAKDHIVQLKDPALGPMNGRYVSPGLATMLRHVKVWTPEPTDPVQKIVHKTAELIREGTGHFKVMKVLLDPVAQVRNMIGNAVLMDMAGVSPFRIDLMKKAFNELRTFARTGELGEYMAAANRAGTSIFQHTFSQVELREIADRLVKLEESGGGWREGFEAVFDVAGRVRRAGIEAFDISEKTFKLTTFIDRYDALRTAWAKQGKALTQDVLDNFASQAASVADRALFNYADVPYMVDFARKYGIVPFITFPFKAAPAVAEALYKHPWRVLKYERVADEWNESIVGTPEQVAEEVEALPEHVRENLVLRLPFKDDEGRARYIDLSYFLPWAVLKSLSDAFQGHESGGVRGLREGMFNPPIMSVIDAFRRGEDGFGNPIFEPSKSFAQNTVSFAGHLIQQFVLPPSWPGGSRAESVGRALQALSTTSPETMRWADALGRAWRIDLSNEDVLVANRYMPQSQAQITEADNSMEALAGFLTGTFLGGSVASDPQQANTFGRIEFRQSLEELYQEIADVRTNPTLSISQKNARISRLRARIDELRAGR